MLVAASLLVLGTPLAAAANHALRRSGAESSWKAPSETSPAEMHAAQVALGWSPRPTGVPRDLMGRMLMPRMDEYTLGPRTCGFDSADGISITCISSDATCTYQTSHIGCCVPNTPCNIIKTTCMDYDASSAGSCNLPRDYHTLCCSASDRPACFTYVLSTTGTGTEPDETFTLFDCSASSGIGTLFDYDPAWAATHTFSSSSTSTTEPASTSTEAGDEGQNNDDDNNNSSNEDEGGDSTPIGAIVGGTVGGVAALGLVGAALFFLLRRRRNKAAAAKPAAPMAQNAPTSPPPQSLHPSSPGGATYPSGVPSSFQGYDQQHMSMYGHPGYNQQGMQPYPPQQFQGQYPPQGFPQQQQGTFAYSASGYQPVPSVSPPPQSTPSPAFKDGPQAAQNVNELQAINPIGNESNRAELGP